MPDIPAYLDGILNGEFSADQRVLIARLMADYLADYYPLARNDYRIAARRLFKFLAVIDKRMSESSNPNRAWREISLALGLPSARYSRLTMTKIGQDEGLSKMAISKSVTRLIHKAEQELIPVTCECCHKTFLPLRSDAKYCSMRCRKRISRCSTVTLIGN